jgi:hypothetical protein
MKSPLKLLLIMSLTLLTVFISACRTKKAITIDNYHIYRIPPGAIKVNDTLFCDQTEMSNIDWLEYMYWNKRIFGSTSEEYLSTLPDTLTWLKMDSCLHSFVLHYHIRKEYPLVGISQEQAMAYSKWRSDRVFEILLYEYKVILYDAAQTRDNYFSIERYFNGELTNVISDKKLSYYPEFRLPTPEERKVILSYYDSVMQNIDKRVCKCDYPEIWTGIIPCKNGLFSVMPTRPVSCNCPRKKNNMIFNLYGNVSEWTSEKNIAAGGSWLDNQEGILSTDTFNIAEPNAWTGFRNVCEWKVWEEKSPVTESHGH